MLISSKGNKFLVKFILLFVKIWQLIVWRFSFLKTALRRDCTLMANRPRSVLFFSWKFVDIWGNWDWLWWNIARKIICRKNQYFFDFSTPSSVPSSGLSWEPIQWSDRRSDTTESVKFIRFIGIGRTNLTNNANFSFWLSHNVI